MRELTIRSNEAGQRLDKFLHKYMKDAPSSLFYKMMRKKNIVLNGSKCTGQEILTAGDNIKLFFSEETFEKFGAPPAISLAAPVPSCDPLLMTAQKAYQTVKELPIVYEDEHILIVNKPAGLLSQKAQPSDLSLNEWLIGYLLYTKAITSEELHTFHPSVCNRLDRNTSGLVMCAKSLAGAQFLTQTLRLRSVHKYYRLFVLGKVTDGICTAWLKKDPRTNKVTILPKQPAVKDDASEIKTGFKTLGTYHFGTGQTVTYAEAELFTGKSHQIRAHFAALGNPLLGDEKYGDPAFNKKLGMFKPKGQMLHAYRIEFPHELEGSFSYLSGKVFLAKEPESYQLLLDSLNPAKELQS